MAISRGNLETRTPHPTQHYDRKLHPRLAVLTALPTARAIAQTTEDLVQKAVNTELDASRSDHSLWHYRMKETQENNSIYDVPAFRNVPSPGAGTS